jgi:hypothetical protein
MYLNNQLPKMVIGYLGNGFEGGFVFRVSPYWGGQEESGAKLHQGNKE